MRRAAVVGLAGLVLAVGVVLLVSDGGGGVRLTAVFDAVPGLVEGAPVTEGGRPVGRVERIALGSDGLPHVLLRLDRSVTARRGAWADLRLGSLSGEYNRFVALHPGRGPALADGATLGLARTDEPLAIDDALSTLDPRTRAAVQATVTRLYAGVRGRGADLAGVLAAAGPALGAGADTLRELNAQGAALRSALGDVHRVSGALAADPGAGGAAVSSLAAVLRRTAVRERTLGATVAGLPGALGAARGLLDSADRSLGPLRALARGVTPVARAAVPFAGALRPAAAAARPALSAARSLLASAPVRFRALAPALTAATRTLPVLQQAGRRAGPILDEARARLPDFFSFFANWADFTSDYDAVGHAARVAVVLSPAPLKTVAPDSSAAGQLVRPFLRDPGVLAGEPWRDYRRSFVAGKGKR